MKTDKPPKGVTARRVSQILIFPPPKSGLNSFQSFCSGARDESFITTYSLINAWNRTRLLLIRRTSDFRLNKPPRPGRDDRSLRALAEQRASKKPSVSIVPGGTGASFATFPAL